jgi:hypothetical protein
MHADVVQEGGRGRTTAATEAAAALIRRAEHVTEQWIAALDRPTLLEFVAYESALLALATKRLHALDAAPVRGDDGEDAWLDVHQVSGLIHRSVSWIRHHPHAVPGRRQTCRGGRVEWSKRAVERWLATLAC